MNKWIRRSVVCVVTLMLFSGSFAWLTQDAFKSGPWCDVMFAWMSDNTLPTTYEGLLELPRSHRAYAAAKLTPEQLSTFNREQANAMLLTRTYTPAQSALIREYIALMSPETMRAIRANLDKHTQDADGTWIPGSAEEEQVRLLDMKARAAFSFEEYVQLFLVTGQPQAAPTTFVSARAALVSWLRSEVLAAPEPCLCNWWGVPPCDDRDCWLHSGMGRDAMCQPSEDCRQGAVCFMGGTQLCDGVCRWCYPEPE